MKYCIIACLNWIYSDAQKSGPTEEMIKRLSPVKMEQTQLVYALSLLMLMLMMMTMMTAIIIVMNL